MTRRQLTDAEKAKKKQQRAPTDARCAWRAMSPLQRGDFLDWIALCYQRPDLFDVAVCVVSPGDEFEDSFRNVTS